MILVAGASGNVGSELVTALAEAGERVRALTRGSASLPDGVEPVIGDLNDPDGLDLSGVERIFLLPGFESTVLLRRAREAGVRHVVLMSGGSAALGDMTNALSRRMIVSERALQESGLAWTIVRPRAFMSNALRWIPQLQAGDTVRVPFADVRTAVVDPYDIAAVVAHVLLTDVDGQAGRIHLTTGPESLLPADQVGALGQVLGRDLRCEGMTHAEARAQLEATMPRSHVDAFFQFFVEGTLDESPVLATVQDVTGRPPRTFEQWAQAHAAAFSAP